MPGSGLPVWALYVITVAIWGSSWYGIKEQLGVVAPAVSLAYRFLLAAAILFVLLSSILAIAVSFSYDGSAPQVKR